MKSAPHGHQHYDLYEQYHEQDSEIRVLLGKCGFNWLFGSNPKPSQPKQPRSGAPDQRTPEIARPPARPAFAHADRVPQGSFRFIALDVETACSDVASICQIGLACVQPDNQIQTFSMLVNPRTRFDPFNIQLHGIGPDHVVDAPHFPDALDSLLQLLTNHHLVQHSSFDKRAMNAACDFCGIDAPELRWSDSVRIARRAWPELKGNGGHGLANLKRTLNLEFQHHDAGEDARAAAMVVLHAEAHLRLPFEDLIKPAPKKSYPAAVTMDGDGKIDGADPSIAALTGRIEVRFADSTLVSQAINGDPCEISFAYVLPSGESFTFIVHAVYLPRPRIEISGPQGVQATFDWQAAKAASPARMCTATRRSSGDPATR